MGQAKVREEVAALYAQAKDVSSQSNALNGEIDKVFGEEGALRSQLDVIFQATSGDGQRRFTQIHALKAERDEVCPGQRQSNL